MKTTYKVSGMTCGGCATSITKALQSLNASAEVDVDLDKAQVSVSGLDAAQVEQAVEDAGFDFDGSAPFSWTP